MLQTLLLLLLLTAASVSIWCRSLEIRFELIIFNDLTHRPRTKTQTNRRNSPSRRLWSRPLIESVRRTSVPSTAKISLGSNHLIWNPSVFYYYYYYYFLFLFFFFFVSAISLSISYYFSIINKSLSSTRRSWIMSFQVGLSVNAL